MQLVCQMVAPPSHHLCPSSAPPPARTPTCRRREGSDPRPAKVGRAQAQLSIRVVSGHQALLAEPEPGQRGAGRQRQRAGGHLALLCRRRRGGEGAGGEGWRRGGRGGVRGWQPQCGYGIGAQQPQAAPPGSKSNSGTGLPVCSGSAATYTPEPHTASPSRRSSASVPATSYKAYRRHWSPLAVGGPQCHTAAS